MTELHIIFHKWYISIMNLYRTGSYSSSTKVLIDEVLQATGLQSEETKEVTEILKEIIDATIQDERKGAYSFFDNISLLFI